MLSTSGSGWFQGCFVAMASSSGGGGGGGLKSHASRACLSCVLSTTKLGPYVHSLHLVLFSFSSTTTTTTSTADLTTPSVQYQCLHRSRLSTKESVPPRQILNCPEDQLRRPSFKARQRRSLRAAERLEPRRPATQTLPAAQSPDADRAHSVSQDRQYASKLRRRVSWPLSRAARICFLSQASAHSCVLEQSPTAAWRSAPS